MGGYAWVTLATNDAYSLGALVLAHSLRRVGTKYELAVLVTPGVTNMMREKLAGVFSLVQEVNVLDSKDEANLALLARPELGITFTKLHCWRLTQYEKCVFVDADTLVMRNCDELFEREELSAAPDVGWPDCFNSGVFVFRPSQQTFASITAFAAAKGSFDGGDQGLLNMYFNDWARKDISKHLPFIYNMCSTATYSYLPAFKQFGEDVRIIHFIGITKPWLQYFDTLTGIVQPPAGSHHLQPLLQLWWNIFCDKVHPQLSPAMATSTLAPIWHDIIPTPIESSPPRNPVYYNDTNHRTYPDVYVETPDFSEFKDPWENYSWESDNFADKNKGEPSIHENVRYSYDNNQICDVSSSDRYVHEGSTDHTYHKQPPPAAHEERGQFHSIHTQTVDFLQKEDIVSILEPRKRDDHTYWYSQDDHNRNTSTEPQQHHWQSEQKIINPSHEHRNEHHQVHHENVHHVHQVHHENVHHVHHGHQEHGHHVHHGHQEHAYHIHQEQVHHVHQEQQVHHGHQGHVHHVHQEHFHQHVHHQPEQVHHFEHQHRTNEDDHKCTRVDDHHVEHHYEKSSHFNNNNNNNNNSSSNNNNNNNNNYHHHHHHHHDHYQHTHHIVQHQEPSHQHQQQSYHNEQQNQNNYYEQQHSHEQHSHKDEQEQRQCSYEDHNYEEKSFQDNVEQGTSTVQTSHDKGDNNISYEHKTHETVNIEQNNYYSNNVDKQTDAQKLTASHPSSEPCTVLHNVGTQSDLNITGHLDSSNAGLAGALAQMTLGEPRSAEQIALEEHMRKQSWEQGQIDYMGRDSFDNIWKKICQTLSSAPPRQPSPPKTTSEDEAKSEKVEVDIAKEASTDLTAQSKGKDEVDSPAAKPTTDLSETQSLICKIPKEDISPQETCAKDDSTISSVQTIDTPQFDKKDESVNINVQSSSVDETNVQLDKTDLKEVSIDTGIKTEVSLLESETICEADAGLPTPPTKEICKETTSTDVPSVDQSSDQTTILEQAVPTDTVQDTTTKEELGKEVIQQKEEEVKIPVDVVQESSTEKDTPLSPVCTSEVMLTNPVPIQVAESVLQTEPKESVTQEVKLITEEAISSTVAPVQESVVASSETLVELTDRTQLCDTTLLVSSNEPANVIDPNTTSSISQNGDTVVNGSAKLSESDSLAQSPPVKDVVEAIESPPQEEVSQQEKTEPSSEQATVTESPPIAQEQITETVEKDTEKDTESKDTTSDVTSEVKAEKLEEAQEAQEVKESTELLEESKPSLESESEECPIRPTRTKELTIPSTPTVTEPTPPTSPIAVSAQEAESQGKAAKKSTKKVVKKTPSDSDSADRADTAEGTEKKTAKKVVKKVVKKPKEGQEEGGESSSSADKPKKTAKGTKKVTKPSQSLETDTSIPETPPPGSSDAPVPPKRKVKASAPTKPASTAQKPDTES